MQKKKHGRREHQVVKLSPKRPTDLRAKERRDDNECKEIKGGGSREVELWLQVGVNGQEDVDEAEMRGVKEEKNDRMAKDKKNRAVSCPLMESKEVDVAIGPPPQWAIAERDKHAKEQVDRYGSNGCKAKIGA